MLLKESAAIRRLRALLDFLRSGSAGGGILIVSGVTALLWANSAEGDQYQKLLRLQLGPETLHTWVNDGLMAIFFLLVGLELRREMTSGQLASASRVAAPALAALGGMIVPAMIFSAWNYHDKTLMRGWAVPVATDIAFALAVLSVLGQRVPIALKVFLTALAIIDDLGAIIVIALFYTATLNLRALGEGMLLLFALWLLKRARVRSLLPYLLGGVVLWALVFRSGVHATLSGVALAFVLPMDGDDGPALRLEHLLQPWVAYVILPLFGLTNAGLRFDTLPPGAWFDTLALGTALGLVLGKQIGVFTAVLAAARLGLARLPAAVTKAQLYGGSILCGIGFTMSLFIGDLAFRQTPRGDEVKLAVFMGSLLSALLGLAVLALVTRRKPGR
ncbi:MAG: Na+/H+ antiporter NhaA [Acetobacteraceae bacterium]|nr:Na+/H+ antiporter NhaA [Acetobacteraceae bacterium]